MELMGIKEVMEMLGIGRPTATRLLSQKSCPTLPRAKGGQYLVPKQAFVDWLNKGAF